jgi:hypothetical protein
MNAKNKPLSRRPLNEEQIAELVNLLNSEQVNETALIEADLIWIASKHLGWWEQDEKGPSRAQRKSSIEAVRDAARKLDQALSGLSTVAEGDLSLAYVVRSESEFYKGRSAGSMLETDIVKLQTHDLAQVADYQLSIYGSKRGPEPAKTLPLTIKLLADIWGKWTGKPVTHTAIKGREYGGTPQSPAGQFILKFFNFVDLEIRSNAISSVLKDEVTRRNRQKS